MIRLRTLGGVDLRDADGREIRTLLRQPKRVALLVYLALADASGYRRRDKVMALFWPELDDEHARGSLRQALTFLRRSLGDGAIVSRGDDEIGVSGVTMDCDATAFMAATMAGMSAEAIALYRGDFLDGFYISEGGADFQSWVEEVRQDLRHRAAACAWSLAERSRREGRPDDAARFAREAVRLTPDNEREVARLIAWLDDLGDRAGAIAAYEEFASRLAREYQAQPAPETQAVIRRIRARTHAIEAAPEGATSMVVSDRVVGAEASPERRKPRWRLWMIGGVAVIAVAAAIVMAVLLQRHPSAVPAAGVPTVAVLPLRDLNSDTSTRYVAEGITDELTTELARGVGVRVISSRTMLAYRDSNLAPDVIAQRYHADAVISGTVQYVGDTVHLSVQVNRAGDAGTQLARSFTGTRAEVLRLQRRIASELIGQFVGEEGSTRNVELTGPVSNSDAIDRYIRGRYLWNKRGGTNLLRSIELFTQALDADPLFAPAYSGMGDAYVQLGYASLLAPSDAFPKAEAAAKHALQLDSTLAEPWATLGFVDLYHRWDWDAADQAFRRAIALNPSYATAYEWYGLYLTAMGRFDEAIRAARRAQELDPLSAAVTGTAAWVLFYSGRVADARREIGIALRMDSNFALGRLYLGRILQEQHHLDSALVAYGRTGPLRDWIPTVAGVAYVDGQLGRYASASATLARMDRMSRSSYVTAYAVALVHAALGNPDSAFAWLERGVQERTHWLVWLNRDRRWMPLRSDPRFAAIVRQVGLPP